MEQIGLEWIRRDWKGLGQIGRDQNGIEILEWNGFDLIAAG